MEIENKHLLMKQQCYEKRKGTSGISGQLYETKLLSLVLLRALRDDNVEDFVLGTNIEGLGEFDDLVFRYKAKDKQSSKIIFLQAKHRDHPTKDKLTVEDILKQNGDFSLQKYLESYLKIKHILLTNNDNLMFQDMDNNVQCDFIIYTSAQESFTKKTSLEDSEKDNFINTKEQGKVFQYKYDDKDIENLTAGLAEYRAVVLAKCLSKFILKSNFNNIMINDFMKIYHVYVAQNILTVEPPSVKNPNNCIGRFRESFLDSTEKSLLLFKQTLFQKIAEMKGLMLPHQQDEVNSILKSLSFKLPINFGNVCFCFHGSEKKQQKRRDYLCSVFQNLFQNFQDTNSEHTFIQLDDNSVGPGKILQAKDLGIYRLGGLVGNLLIHDGKTEMLKFNISEQNLTEDNIKILHRLKKIYDLDRFRFEFNISNFPKLTLTCKKHDEIIIRDFLNKLKFYTNQAKEDEVENIIKGEINSFTTVQGQSDTLFRVKCDAIFFIFHDEIQKWWKQPNSVEFLTKTCDFLQKAEREILESPLLNVVNFTYTQQIKNVLVEFEHKAIASLGLEGYLTSEEKIMIILSDQIHWTSKKILQYFEEIKKNKNYMFLDFDFAIVENCLGIIESELNYSTTATLVIISREQNDSKYLYKKIQNITKLFKGKIIIVTHFSAEDDLEISNTKIRIQNDNKNNFMSFSSNIRKTILEERKFLFQGILLNFNKVLDEVSMDLLSSDSLSKIIENKYIMIGQTVYKQSYKESINYYINRSLCRFVTLNDSRINAHVQQNINKHKNMELYFEVDYFNAGSIPPRINDIIFTTDSEEIFDMNCKHLENKNIHRFTQNQVGLKVWQKSYGSLKTIMKYVDRESHTDYTTQVKTLKDIQEKVVIINAEPGMGKSTLLTHVAIDTKQLYPNLWIIQINLLDCIDQFNEWKERKTNLDLAEVMKFLYRTAGIKNDTNFDAKISQVNLFEVNLFTHFFNNNNVAVLLDGFDEICPDYTNEVTQLLCALKSSKIAHLWITSRPYNILNNLELALETFSFNLNAFTITEQKQFLRGVWFQKIGFEKSLYGLSCACVEHFYSEIKTVLNDLEGKFMGLPLHLFMIADIYQNVFKNYIGFMTGNIKDEDLEDVKAIANLNTLYEKFTDVKFFNIRFGEKKHSLNLKDPDIRKMIAEERKLFVENHKKIAAYSLLNRDQLFSENDYKAVEEFIENINSGEEKTGVIKYVFNGNPQFVHFTFGEYFAVEFLFDKLYNDRGTTTWKYFLNHILLDVNYGIRKFINSKLQRNEDVINMLRSKETYAHIVFEALQAQLSTNSLTMLTVAITENLEHIFIFLLECIKTVLNMDNLHFLIKLMTKTQGSLCLFCISIYFRRLNAVRYVIKLAEDIDRSTLKQLFVCKDTPILSPLMLSFASERMFHIIMDSIQHDADFVVQLFTMPFHQGLFYTAAHYICKNSHTMSVCKPYLLNLNHELRVKIFSVRDPGGELPLHVAGKENDYNLFYIFDEILGREEFKKMCKSTDNAGFTPICRLVYNELYFDKLKDLLEKVYEDSNVDLDYYVFNKFPELYPKNLAPQGYKLGNCIHFGDMSTDDRNSPLVCKSPLAYAIENQREQSRQFLRKQFLDE